MPRNDVTGEYTLPPVWFQDMANAINKCVAVDGKSTITADIPLDNHKITGLANGTNDSDAATIAQARNGSMLWGGSAGGTADALTVTLTPAIAGYGAGQTIRFITGAANAGPATLSVDTLPATPIARGDGSALVAGDLPGGELITVVYDGSAFRLAGWLSADLAAIDGLTGIGLIERTADGTAAVVPLSAAGKALLDDTDAAAQRATLGLGTAATADAANLRDRANHTGTQAVNTITGLHTVATSGSYSDLSGRPTLGTAAALNAGSNAGEVLLLAEANKLPALDGSQLTGLTTGSLTIQDEGSGQGSATVLNFIGSGVTATVSGGVATIALATASGAMLDADNKASGVTLSNGSLTAAFVGTDIGVRSTATLNSGRYYWEIYIDSVTAVKNACPVVGVSAESANWVTWVFGTPSGWGYRSNGEKINDGISAIFGSPYTAGDVVGIAYDSINGKIWFSKNGSWQGSGNPASGNNPAFTGLSSNRTPVIWDGNSDGDCVVSARFSANSWAHAAPSGFSQIP